MKKILLGGLTAALLVGGAAFADDAMNHDQAGMAQPGDLKGDTLKHDAAPGTGMGGDSTVIDRQAKGAEVGTQAAPASMADQSGAMSMQGTITKAKSDKLTVKGQDGKKQQVFLDTGSTVLRDGKVVSAKELKKGDDVRVSFDQRGNKIYATTITASSGMGMDKGKLDNGMGQDKVNMNGSSITQPAPATQTQDNDPSLNGNTPGTQYRKESGRTNPNTNNAGVQGNIGVSGQPGTDPGQAVNPPSNPDTK